MAKNVAITGFGRIGRMCFRKLMMDGKENVVAINASYPAETIRHLIKYDSVHGKFEGEVEILDEHRLEVCGKEVLLLAERDPLKLPWKELEVDIVIEATGKFRSKEKAGYHIEAGAKKVVITAPGENEDVTIVMGVNDKDYDHENHHVVSNASCTTNCLAPVAKILDENFGIEHGLVTTVHAYTNDQHSLDNPHKDLRRSRSCTTSIIPTTTGAAKAISLVLPHLKGKLNGTSLRVPTPDVSLVDLVVTLKKEVTEAEVNAAFEVAAKTDYKGILDYTDEPLVSVDFTTDPHSAIVDGLSTMVIQNKQVKVLAWYDNEWGYACRVVDLVGMIAEKMEEAVLQ
ncbi:glyceraldehyde-3-phosphate dehydrogenase [Listeria floridensis FSL S10-1187]|uniref:Glyceraldehyde-3-phosphate dehydrogenase n=1 Tax=Listeria floridensis FSL S10-1187 TaxID=1265817 RepID=A0ABN0RDT2_9LIST|nr:glyceraldehyde-3-phosphate dehydrogenase [Listeria floridensis]EUJ29719.1 glyceraldehyde-3-phosphate dehydrogenase [Listeria floridensis FSL S10-1187]